MDDENLTTEDLYGPTSSGETSSDRVQIPIEETPEIPMDAEVGTPAATESLQPEMPVQPQGHIPPPPPMPTMTHQSGILTVIIFIVLFIAGIFLSSYIRPLLTGGGTGTVTTKPSSTTTQDTRTEIVPTETTPVPTKPFAGWQESTFGGVSYKLPPKVAVPTCDGTGCISQGTYLPGGTRFTVAPKTVTQPLSTLRGVVITDVAGEAFTSSDATVSGHMAVEFTGTFSGRTSGGYGFSQMHGFMIELSPTKILEVNHFTPAGVTADFGSDDALFTQIISTLNFSSNAATTTQ